MHRSSGVRRCLIRSRVAVFLPFVIFLAACGGTSVTEISGPSAIPGGSGNRCETTFGATLPTVSAEGGRLEVPVVAARECAWTAATDSNWAQIAPATGQGEATVVLT